MADEPGKDTFLTKKQMLISDAAQMRFIGDSFKPHLRELGEYILPRRTRFLVDDVNKGDKRSGKIINSTATAAADTLRSGMMGGITSPARSWFDLGLQDFDEPTGPVKAWLEECNRRMNSAFNRSNLYKVLPINYGDMGTFGLGGIIIEEDMQDVIRCTSLPIGSFYISNNDKGRVDKFYREFQMTVRQIVEKFGMQEDGKIDWTNISQVVRTHWQRGNIELGINICHMISPNYEYDPNALHSKYFRYSSCYWERGVNADGRNYELDSNFLQEKGYAIFPGLFSRWEVTGEDAYPTKCPGITSLGDIKQLQFMEKRSSKAVDKMIDPPMTAPVGLMGKRSSILPGDVTYVNSKEEAETFKPAHEVSYNIEMSEKKIAQIARRINTNFYVDLFKMLIEDQRNDRMTAAEVYARQQEKLLALGPVLEQLNYDLLDPLINITFDIMIRQNKLPVPPQEIEGATLSVKYVSIMAQAQKLVGVGTQERFLGIITNLVGIDPAVLDTIDIDKFVEIYGDSISLPFGIIRDPDVVAKIRASRAKQQQAQQQAETAATTAKAAKDLSGTDMTKDSLLTQLTDASRAGQLAPQAR